MENLDFFFPDLNATSTREILLFDATPFSFLLRKVKKHYVVSFLDEKLQVHHQLIPQRQDSTIHQLYPNLSPREVFEFIRSKSIKWLYPVTQRPNILNAEIRNSQDCDICDCLNVGNKKAHKETHQIIFCQNCEGIIPKPSYGQHRFNCNSVMHQCNQCFFKTKRRTRLGRRLT